METVIINYVRINLVTGLDDSLTILIEKQVEEKESITHDFASRGKPTFRPSTPLPHSKDWGATNYWTQIFHQISPAKKKKQTKNKNKSH